MLLDESILLLPKHLRGQDQLKNQCAKLSYQDQEPMFLHGLGYRIINTHDHIRPQIQASWQMFTAIFFSLISTTNKLN